MNGQWIGTLSEGTNSGTALLNIDLVNDKYEGQVYFFDTNQLFLTARVHLERKENSEIRGYLSTFQPINNTFPLIDSWDNVKKYIDPKVRIPCSGELTANITNEQTLEGSWKTDIGTNGNFKLEKSITDAPSTHAITQLTWKEYKKEYAQKLEHGRFIFRGQPEPKRLRTAYHRTGRADLMQYSKYIDELQHHVCAQTNKTFNLNDPIEYAALLSLGQHHGFPTPLLDWTESPYIAAYFAYASLTKENSNTKVRIYILDNSKWHQNTLQIRHIHSAALTVTAIKSMPIFNNRTVPQQSITTFSNVDDIESFIQGRETRYNETYLTILELPSSEKKVVLQELYIMGINAGSLFPGLDGSCRMLKEKHFL